MEKGIEGEIWTMEVECRAFPAILMATFLRDIEIGGGERRRSLKKFGEEQNDEAKQYGARLHPRMGKGVRLGSVLGAPGRGRYHW